MQDPVVAGIILCLLLSGIVFTAFLFRAPGMGSDIWSSGDVSLSPDEKQIARENFTTQVRLEEGEVIWIDYEPESVSCIINHSGRTRLDSGEKFTVNEDGNYVVRFESRREVRLHYEIHKEGYKRGSISFSILPLIPASLLFTLWYYMRDRAEYEEDEEFSAEEEAFEWGGVFGEEEVKLEVSEPQERNLSYLVVPFMTLPASLLTYYLWQDIHSVFLLLGPSRLSFCCGWAVFPLITAFFSGMLISSSSKLLSSEAIAGLTGALFGSIFAAGAHIFVVYYGSYVLLAGLYGAFTIFYLTAVLEYRVTG